MKWCCFVLLGLSCTLCGSALSEDVFKEPAFEKGFLISARSTAARPLELGYIYRHRDLGVPAWRLAQWGTRLPLGLADVERGEGYLEIGNAAKTLVLREQADGGVDLTLSVSGAEEYGKRLRLQGEAWPHLLIEQRFTPPAGLEAAAPLRFQLSFQVEAVKPLTEDRDPNLHTAQVSAFWTVHNIREDSPHYREMIWFGIPIFDARYDFPRGHQALDAGQEHASGKFIYVPEGTRFYDAPTGNGAWHRINVTLNALLEEALAAAHVRGHLSGSKPEDYALGSFNLGWELTGPFDAQIHFKGLRLWRDGACQE